MAERSIAAVLKTVDLKGSGGSNPSLSARQKQNGKMGSPACHFAFSPLSLSFYSGKVFSYMYCELKNSTFILENQVNKFY